MAKSAATTETSIGSRRRTSAVGTSIKIILLAKPFIIRRRFEH
jgi:hypothetical protein